MVILINIRISTYGHGGEPQSGGLQQRSQLSRCNGLRRLRPHCTQNVTKYNYIINESSGDFQQVGCCASQPVTFSRHPSTCICLTGLRNTTQENNIWQWRCGNYLVYRWNYELAMKTIVCHCVHMWEVLVMPVT